MKRSYCRQYLVGANTTLIILVKILVNHKISNTSLAVRWALAHRPQYHTNGNAAEANNPKWLSWVSKMANKLFNGIQSFVK